MGKHTPNTTEYGHAHKSTTPSSSGNRDNGREVVTSRSYDSSGRAVRGSARHHTSTSGDTGMFNAIKSLFGSK